MKIDTSRLITWIGGVDEENMRRVTERIILLHSKNPKKEIILSICSHGGLSEVGFSFFDFVRMIKPRLVTIGHGEISSMALIVWLAGNQRYLTEHTLLLLHEGARVVGSGTHTTTQLHTAWQNTDGYERMFAKLVAQKSRGKLTGKDVRRVLKKERTFTPRKAVKMGLAHGVI